MRRAFASILVTLLFAAPAVGLESGQTCDDGYEEFVASGEKWNPAPELVGLPGVEVSPGS